MPQWKVSIHSYTSSDFRYWKSLCMDMWVWASVMKTFVRMFVHANVCSLEHIMHLLLPNICIPPCLACRKLWLNKPTALSAIGCLPLIVEIRPWATTPQSKFDTQEGVFSLERGVSVVGETTFLGSSLIILYVLILEFHFNLVTFYVKSLKGWVVC